MLLRIASLLAVFQRRDASRECVCMCVGLLQGMGVAVVEEPTTVAELWHQDQSNASWPASQ